MEKNELRQHELGVAIARARASRDCTQAELSRDIGNSSHSHLSRVECGRKAPSLKMLFKLADALNVEVRYFFSRVV